MDLKRIKKEHEAELTRLRQEVAILTANERLQQEQKNLPNAQASFHSKFFKEFSVLDILRDGKFGYLFETTCVLDMNTYAVARIAFESSETLLAKAHELTSMLSRIDHPGIIRCYCAWIETPPDGWQTWSDENMFMNLRRKVNETEGFREDSSFIYITTELCRQSLETWLHDNQELSLSKAKMWFKQIVDAVAYLYQRNLFIGNIKPSNVMIINANTVKIYHLDIVSKIIHEDDEEKVPNRTSEMRMSPEHISTESNSNIDFFALGLILAELCAVIPKNEENPVLDSLQPSVLYPSPEVEDFVKWLTFEKPAMAEILDHAFLRDTGDESNCKLSRPAEMMVMETSAEMHDNSQKMDEIDFKQENTLQNPFSQLMMHRESGIERMVKMREERELRFQEKLRMEEQCELEKERKEMELRRDEEMRRIHERYIQELEKDLLRRQAERELRIHEEQKMEKERILKMEKELELDTHEKLRLHAIGEQERQSGRTFAFKSPADYLPPMRGFSIAGPIANMVNSLYTFATDAIPQEHFKQKQECGVGDREDSDQASSEK